MCALTASLSKFTISQAVSLAPAHWSKTIILPLAFAWIAKLINALVQCKLVMLKLLYCAAAVETGFKPVSYVLRQETGYKPVSTGFGRMHGATVETGFKPVSTEVRQETGFKPVFCALRRETGYKPVSTEFWRFFACRIKIGIALKLSNVIIFWVTICSKVAAGDVWLGRGLLLSRKIYGFSI